MKIGVFSPATLGLCRLAVLICTALFLVTCGQNDSSSFRLTVNKTGDGEGVVTGDPGIDCGTNCEMSYIAGSVVTLSATQKSGSSFAGWTGCDSADDHICTVTLNANKSITASFDRCDYTILPKDYFTFNAGTFGRQQTITVETSHQNCLWIAVSNESWLYIPGSGNGAGTGTFDIVIPKCPDNKPRKGTITVSGKTITIDQKCSFPYVMGIVTGYVKKADGTPLDGVTVTTTLGGIDITNDYGAYVLITESDGKGILTCRKAGFSDYSESFFIDIGSGQEAPIIDCTMKYLPDAFTDVPVTYWAYGYISAVNGDGIMSGYEDQTFKPENLSAIEEAVSYVIKAKEGDPPPDYCATGATTCNDVDASRWSCRYWKRIIEEGILPPLQTCYPALNIAQKHIAFLFVRAKEGDPPADYCATGSPFSDVPVTDTYCPYIKRLYEMKISVGNGDGTFGPDDPVTRAQMASYLSRAFLGMQ